MLVNMLYVWVATNVFDHSTFIPSEKSSAIIHLLDSAATRSNQFCPKTGMFYCPKTGMFCSNESLLNSTAGNNTFCRGVLKRIARYPFRNSFINVSFYEDSNVYFDRNVSEKVSPTVQQTSAENTLYDFYSSWWHICGRSTAKGGAQGVPQPPHPLSWPRCWKNPRLKIFNLYYKD